MRIEGLDRLESAFAVFPGAAQDQIKAALVENATRLRELAKALAPVDEGTLKASIAARQGRHNLEIVVSAGNEKTLKPWYSEKLFDYAAYNEFDDDPYFFRAYRALRKGMRARLNRAIRQAAQQTFRG